jgi:hypothetical protein
MTAADNTTDSASVAAAASAVDRFTAPPMNPTPDPNLVSGDDRRLSIPSDTDEVGYKRRKRRVRAVCLNTSLSDLGVFFVTLCVLVYHVVWGFNFSSGQKRAPVQVVKWCAMNWREGEYDVERMFAER